jgi:hypothetical protein
MRNSRADLALLQVRNSFNSSHFLNSPEGRGSTTKEMLKMKDDPDELLKTNG